MEVGFVISIINQFVCRCLPCFRNNTTYNCALEYSRLLAETKLLRSIKGGRIHKTTSVIFLGGSNGLGRAIAVELCLRGAKVISACRTRLRRESTAVYLREKTGSFNHRLMYMDLNNLESIRTFAQEVLDTEDRVDGLINNAG